MTTQSDHPNGNDEPHRPTHPSATEYEDDVKQLEQAQRNRRPRLRELARGASGIASVGAIVLRATLRVVGRNLKRAW